MEERTLSSTVAQIASSDVEAADEGHAVRREPPVLGRMLMVEMSRRWLSPTARPAPTMGMR